MYLILLSFLAALYARIASISGITALENIVWILQAIGGLTFIIVAPYFYHSLLGLSLGRWMRILFFINDAGAVAGASVDLALPAFFFPLMCIDTALSYTRFLGFFQFLDNLTLPAYFLVLNCLTIVFGLRYMNRPAYVAKNNLTPYFLSTYHITDREREIIGSLLEGAGSRRIAEALFISEKTVENHIYNIYQKLHVRNRVQMFQLIRANKLE